MEKAEAEVQEVARVQGSGPGHPRGNCPHCKGRPETRPECVPIRHARGRKSWQRAESLQDQAAWRHIPQTDKTSASKAEVVSIDNRYRTVVSATIENRDRRDAFSPPLPRCESFYNPRDKAAQEGEMKRAKRKMSPGVSRAPRPETIRGC
jgi:hypothetical protein